MLPTTSRKAFGRLAQLLPTVGLSALTPAAPSAATSSAADPTAAAGAVPRPAVRGCSHGSSDPVPPAQLADGAVVAGAPRSAPAAGATTVIGPVATSPDVTVHNAIAQPAPVMSAATVAGPRVVTVNATRVTEIDARTLHVEQGTIATTNEVHQVIQAGGDAHVSTPITSAVVTASGHRAVAVTHTAEEPADTRFGTGAEPPAAIVHDTHTETDTAHAVPAAEDGVGPTGSNLAAASAAARPQPDDTAPPDAHPDRTAGEVRLGTHHDRTAGERRVDGPASAGPVDASAEPDELLRSVQPGAAQANGEDLTVFSQLPDDAGVDGPSGGSHDSTVVHAASHGTLGHTPDAHVDGGRDALVRHDVDHDG